MTTVATAVRQPLPNRSASTPYARRLARERNLSLANIRGSGPGGRVTGADVLRTHTETAVNPPAPPTPVTPDPKAARADHVPSPALQISRHSAIAARISTRAASELLEQLRPFSQAISIHDICIKAAATALDAAIAQAHQEIQLTSGKDRTLINNASTATLSGIARQREARALPVSLPLFEISFLSRPGIRPVSKAPTENGIARLVIGAADLDHVAECLLCYEESRLDDVKAESFLAEFREHVEMPLRLMA